MLSYEPICKKTDSSPGQDGADGPVEPASKFDPAKHVAPAVAHELNNILTIVQGYSDRLLLRHGEDPALVPQLRLISEAAKRAAAVVRAATPPNAHEAFRQNLPPAPAAA